MFCKTRNGVSIRVKKAEIEERTKELLLPILEREGLELWDVEYVKEGKDMYLRAYIDKQGGVDINNCVTVSRALEQELDREDFIPEAYILEVSSPGLTRPLKKTVDFERSIGRLIEVKTYQPIEGRKEFEGILKAGGETTIDLETDGTLLHIERSNLAKARLCYVEEEITEEVTEEVTEE